MSSTKSGQKNKQAIPTLTQIAKDVTKCRACPRLVKWREQVAIQKRAQYKSETYWGKPVPGFGDSKARIVIVGLAPAAHGANRTGRMFTGDRSGDWLYAALHRAGLASQAESFSKKDGLKLKGVYITAPLKCAPPANKPEQKELQNCRPFIEKELEFLKTARVFLALGQVAYTSLSRLIMDVDLPGSNPRPPFSHGLELELSGGRHIICSYHTSQQNTFTGRLTRPMFDKVVKRAKQLSGLR